MLSKFPNNDVMAISSTTGIESVLSMQYMSSRGILSQILSKSLPSKSLYKVANVIQP